MKYTLYSTANDYIKYANKLTSS